MSGACEEFEASVEAAEGDHEVKRLEGAVVAGLEACDVTVPVVLCRVLVMQCVHLNRVTQVSKAVYSNSVKHRLQRLHNWLHKEEQTRCTTSAHCMCNAY